MNCVIRNRVWLLLLTGFGLGVFPAQAQPRQNPVVPATAASPAAASSARLSSRELARKIAESIDAGDTCPGVNGSLRLRRVPGKLAVTLPTGTSSLAARWSNPGQPLAGYEPRSKPTRQMVLMSGSSQESMSQRSNPSRLRQSLARARAGGLSVNPVFLDPGSGLELLATEQLVVMLKPGTEAGRYFGGMWKQVRPVWGTTNQYLLSLPGASAERIFAEATRRQQHADVVWVEPDFVRQAWKSSTPNDPYFASRQWNLLNTGQGGGRAGADAKLPAAWDITPGSPNVIVAILDDGVQISHPDIAPNLFLNTGETPNNGLDDDHNGVIDDVHGYNFFSGGPDPSPVDATDSHGTCVAGIAVAAGNNSQGMAGAAYGCRLLPLKILESDFLVPDSTLAAALHYAAGFNSSGQRTWRGADVLNMSLLFTPSFVVSSALTDAATRGRNGLGCGIFAAAGNSASAWQPYELIIQQAGTYTLRWEYTKDSSRSDGDDTVWVDGVTYPDGTTESFQSGFPAGWTTGGAVPWTSVLEGVNGNRALVGWDGPAARSLRAGAIGADQTTYLQVTKTLGPGTLSFWAWVSTERDFDVFRFRVDGREIFSESGVPLPDTVVSYPASHPACFAVGSSTDFDYRADYSQYGIALDFLAPSDGGASTIFTCDRTGMDGYNTDPSPGGDYAFDFGGTSAASPLGAGIAALVYSANPYLTSGDLRALMRSTCDRIGGVTYDAAGRNHFYGSGRVNAFRAVSRARTDLRVTLAASSGFANVNDITTYTASVQNISSAPSGPSTLTNQLPAGVAFASANPAPSSRSGSRLVFAVPSLAPNQTFSCVVRVTNQVVGTNVFLGGAISGALDGNVANNTNVAVQVVYPVPVISIADATVNEGNAGVTNAVFEVTLSNPSVSTVTVGFATVTNTASAGDYSATRGVVTIPPGQTNKTVLVRVLGDVRNEGDERFFVVLTNAVHAVLGRAVATGLILNDDPLPSLSISDVVVTEGNAGVRKATFKVLLAPPSGRAVTVDYATASGSAVSGLDFIPTNGTLTFPAGKTIQKLVVPVIGDTAQESNLTFTVNLSNPLNATLAQAQGIGNILNNDRPPKVYIGNATVTEGDVTPTNAVFEVRLSAASGLTVSMTFATTNGSAFGGTDYVATNGVLTFAAGTTNQTILIPVLGDFLSESNETFSVSLANLTNAVAGDLVGLATVQDNDPLPSLDVQGAADVIEPAPGASTNQAFAVTLSQPSGRTIRVKYATANGSALAGADFVARSGSLLFTPGTSNQVVEIAIKSDNILEPDETFSLNLSEPINAVLGSATAPGVIIDAGSVAFRAASLSTKPGPLLQATFHQGALRIRFQTMDGERYALEWTPTGGLMRADWRPVAGASEIIGNGLIMEVTDAEAAARPQAFYRVRRLP